MSRKTLVVVGLVGFIAWVVYASGRSVAPGHGSAPGLGTAPDITIAPIGAERVSLSDFKGKVVLVDFWATWCGPCEASIPAIQRVYDKYRARGFEVLGVAMEHDDGRGVPAFVKRMGMTYKIGLPTAREMVQAYGMQSIPLMVLVDRSGEIRWRQEGYGPGVAEELESRIESLL